MRKFKFFAAITRFFANAKSITTPKEWYSVKNLATEEVAEITIYDQIGMDWWTGDGIQGKKFVEDLAKIPMNKAIKLRINCPGGSVNDGMLIYNRLAERRDNLEVVIDGLAASIGSVIALAGKTLEMPNNTLFMVHEPWGIGQGTAEDFRRAAVMLDKHGDNIASVYANKTGMTMEECHKMMAKETWMTGQEAKDAKFCDKVTEEIDFQACFDLSRFKHVPAIIESPAPETPATQRNTMNRKQIIARLKKLGVAFDMKATDEALLALLAAQNEGNTDPQNQAQDDEPDPNDQHEDEDDEEDNEPSSPAASTDTAAARNRQQPRSQRQRQADPAVATMREELNRVQSHLAQERRTRVTASVQRCVDEDRIPATQRDVWVTRALADEAVLTDLQAMPQRPPGVKAMTEITSEAPSDIARGVMALRDPLKSWLRGNLVEPKAISIAAVAMSTEITKHRAKLVHVMNATTNAVDADLKRNVILNDLMRAFKRKIINLNVFATTFTNIPLLGTNKIVVPYYELDTTHSRHYNAAVGYLFEENTDTVTRDFTIDHRQYKSMEFQSETFRRQPYFNPPMSLMLKAEQLALDVWYDVLSIIKASNFPQYAAGGAASSFDVDDVATIRGKANKLDWPDLGRSLVLDTDRETSLLQDDSLKAFLQSGSTEPLRNGSTGRLFGFEMYYSPRIIGPQIPEPNTPEDIGGFACMPQAILVGTAPIAPAPGVMRQLLSYDLVVDPDLGVALEYKYWGEPQRDADRQIVECNYGYKKGNSDALIRVNNTDQATLETSSSSSSGESASSSSS